MAQQDHRVRPVWIAIAVLSVVPVVAVAVASSNPASASSQPGSRTLGAPASGPPDRCGAYRPPVDAPVVDRFRLPDGHYGAGNRGLEYGTSSGQPVRAVNAGRVSFSGPVAGRIAVSIRHPDGRVSSLTGLEVAAVVRGELVARGAVVGTAGSRTHLGVREDGRYVDPAPLLCVGRRRAVLVPGGP